MFQRTPYRYRIPLLVSLIVVTTGVLFTLALGWQSYHDMQRAVLGNARLLASTYANSLVEPLKHGDIWRAYSLIRSSRGDAAEGGVLTNGAVLVLDRQGRTFVSTRPKIYPVGLREAVLTRLRGKPDGYSIRMERKKVTVISQPVEEGGAPLGQVVLFLPEGLYLTGVYRLAGRIVLIILLLLILLVPVGWLAGRRLSEPIASLGRCLDRLEKDGPQAASCELYEGSGELGAVGRKLREVLNQLVEKAALEQQVIAEERLAAIGRLSAGVAHEVNNPLAGMMTALDTFKHHGTDPRVAQETVALLERGLGQIRHTVSALLLQSRRQDRSFTRQDIEDIRSLLSRDFSKKRVRLAWCNEVKGSLPLPAADLRQILINLLINAVQAVPEGGEISQCSRLEREMLVIEISNDGDTIPPELRPALFEPFSGISGSGSGLGLWVTAQLAERMQGRVDVESEHGRTSFRITIPIREELHA